MVRATASISALVKFNVTGSWLRAPGRRCLSQLVNQMGR